MKKSCIRILSAELALVLILFLSGCYSYREKAYYSDRNNYITEEATVDNIIYNEEDNYVVLWLSDIDPQYQANAFIFRGENASEVLKNGILSKVNIGDMITFTSAPCFFGNGYFMPIVELYIGEEAILEFEIGYQNLLNSY